MKTPTLRIRKHASENSRSKWRINYWFLVSQELTFYSYPHPLLSNLDSNSTVSFMSLSLPFKHHLTSSFHLPFHSYLSHFLSFSFILPPPPNSHFFYSLAPLLSLLFALGCILATAMLIKKGWEGPSVLPRLPVFPALTGGSTCTPIIMNQMLQHISCYSDFLLNIQR